MKSFNAIQRKGFFFTLDALLALGVLVTGFLLILGFQTFKPIDTQPILFAEDFLNLFSTTKIIDADSELIFRMWCTECPEGEQLIKRNDNTLLEQIAEFVHRSKGDQKYIDKARIIADEMGDGLINEQFNYEFSIKIEDSINGEEKVILLQHGRKSFDDTNLLITSKRLIYGIYDNQLIGPYVAEVRIWQ
jgi:hypothetical protein